MSQSPLEIKRVVREVLAELAAAPVSPRPLGEGQGVRAAGKTPLARPTGEGLGVRAAEKTPLARPTGEGQGVRAAGDREQSALTLTLSQRERGQEKSQSPISNPQPPTSNPQSLIPSPSLSPLPSPLSPDFHIAARVVTMNEIAGRLASARRVVVSREAIVTPAVRDELLRCGIALEYADDAANCRPTVRLAIVASGTDFDPASLMAALTREGFSVECTSSDCLIAATDQLAAEASKPDTLGVLLTRHAAAALCLANRLPGVRAIFAIDAPSVAAAASAVGANVLVVDPRAGSFFQLKQMVTEFGCGGVRPCPKVFQEQLA